MPRSRSGITASFGDAPWWSAPIPRAARAESWSQRLGIWVIPGIGSKTELFLQQQGLKTVAGLRQVELGQLREWLGKGGEDLYRKARGISDDPVSNEWEPKSVGEQETFEEDTRDPVVVRERAQALANTVFRRFVGAAVARSLTSLPVTESPRLRR
jgi:nucleotidyltransferase/DNA polymerase involved in DNA repair